MNYMYMAYIYTHVKHDIYIYIHIQLHTHIYIHVYTHALYGLIVCSHLVGYSFWVPALWVHAVSLISVAIVCAFRCCFVS